MLFFVKSDWGRLEMPVLQCCARLAELLRCEQLLALEFDEVWIKLEKVAFILRKCLILLLGSNRKGITLMVVRVKHYNT
jgi:hypothetical protein